MIIIISGILVIFFTFMLFKAHHDIVDDRVIVDERLPDSFDPFKIFFIADIHRRNINKKTLDSINLTIDLVLIGGDLTEKGVPLGRTKNNIRKLKKFGVPIFFVWGNNDYEVPITPFVQLLYEENVIILKDEVKEISRGRDIVSLIGFDDYKDNDLQRPIHWENICGTYTILLTHKPSSFYQLPVDEQKNIHMVFSAHTHGGQIRLFGLGFYQRGGLTTHQKTNVFVTEGYGYTFLPFRLQTRAECHMFTFQKKK